MPVVGPLHDLILELAKAMARTDGALEPAATAAGATKPDDLAKVLAGTPDLPELVTFAGYLGGTVAHPSGTNWRLLYLDWQLRNWLLVDDDRIVFNTTLDDDKSPFRRRDVIWVSEDTSVGTGSGSQSVESRFLTGEFTRAGDFEAPLTGGTAAAATGVFCEAKTPLCCTRYSK